MHVVTGLLQARNNNNNNNNNNDNNNNNNNNNLDFTRVTQSNTGFDFRCGFKDYTCHASGHRVEKCFSR